jgi:V/A-type H+-transporting ATPase subunit E
MDKVKELEAAILARAERLADQYRHQAQLNRDEILRDSSEKLRLREEREVLLGKALADRAYRRNVQSNELKLQAHMDQLRWNLVKSVTERLEERLDALTEQDEAYLQVLRGFLQAGLEQIQQPEVVIEVNKTDQERLHLQWQEFTAGIDPQVKLSLDEQPLHCRGGLLLRSPDNLVRLDNTFEGRMHRLSRELHRAIQERLLPPSLEDVSAGTAGA